MGFQASLCFFFLLAFAMMCFARNIPSENVAAFSTEDYGPPGPNPKHNPHPPPNFPSENVAAFSTEDYGPPGPNPKHNPQPPPHSTHVVALYSPPPPPDGQGHSPETGQ
uniref:Uncharacterized protein n=1 Tax=Fagus sylvatica TaxID=28930 RepID=A0A2N9G4D8_FAGSY